MNTWVLIIVLTVSQSSRGTQVEHVTGFKTREGCVAAGQQWINYYKAHPWFIASALCMEQK